MQRNFALASFTFAIASVVLVACGSSEQAATYRKNRAALEAYEKQRAEEDARRPPGGVASKEDREKAIQQGLDAEKQVAILHSAPIDADGNFLNPIVAKIESYHACKAVPDLMRFVKESPDDYVAGLAAQAVTMCFQRDTYDTIINEFLRRQPSAIMLDAVERINSTDPRVIEKVKNIIADQKEDQYTRQRAQSVKAQIERTLMRPI